MLYRQYFIVFVALQVMRAGWACAQQPTVPNPIFNSATGQNNQQATLIFPGQQVGDTQRLLQARNVEFREGGFAFAGLDAEQSNLIFTIDENSTLACVYFSKRLKTVTGISLIFFPSKDAHRKVNESWLRVKSLQLNDDKSYTAHFAPPTTVQVSTQPRENQSPLPSLPLRTPMNGKAVR